MAKTLAQKLLIKPGYRVAILDAPAHYTTTLGALPDGVTVVHDLDGSFDLIQVFVTKRENIEGRVEALKDALVSDGLLWVCYPKGGAKAKVPTDLNRDSLYALLLEHRLEGIAMISIDDTWSAMRLKRI
jgi:hypothetical protein